MYCIYAAPQGAKTGRNNKGVAGAGWLPSLLALVNYLRAVDKFLRYTKTLHICRLLPPLVVYGARYNKKRGCQADFAPPLYVIQLVH